MKKIIKNYKSTLILLGSVVIGAICGLIFKEKAEIVKPLGDLFLNLLLVIIVPLIFFTITSSISKMNEKKRLSKILISTIVIFLITSVVAVLFGFLTTAKINLVNPENTEAIKEVFDNKINKEEDIEALGLSVLGVTAYAQTSDFSNPNYKKETLDSDTSMSPGEQELSRLSKRKKR